MIQYEEGINFRCMLNGHDIHATDHAEEIKGTGIRKHKCRRCEKPFLRDPMGKFVPWNEALDEVMEAFAALTPYREDE